MKGGAVDRWFLGIVLALLGGGLIIFYSASLGILAKQGSGVFGNILISQLVLGLFFGGLACIAAAFIPYRFWRAHALFFFVAAVVLSVLVFVPGIGARAGGASRWIYFGPLSLQPSEFLKLGFILYFAAFLAQLRGSARESWRGVIAFIVLIGVVAVLVLAQPDTGTFGIIFFSGAAMLLVSGAPLRAFMGLLVAAIIGLVLLATIKPHVAARIETFFDPSKDLQGSGYQLRQSLTAIGSGQITGRGFGKSIQKFHYLPEPVGDSIFAVAAEEFGFIGSCIIIISFLLLGVRGLMIARYAPDQFSGLLTVGIVILMVSQAFLNITSMLGIFPLTGVPLPFVSHGGSALLVVLAGAGIILNISRFRHLSSK
ncbi:MAG: putative lipid II flippase FtsW [Minisyncoccota bacterium]